MDLEPHREIEDNGEVISTEISMSTHMLWFLSSIFACHALPLTAYEDSKISLAESNQEWNASEVKRLNLNVVEGDILLPNTRSGIIDDNKRWPDNNVYYMISSEFTNTELLLMQQVMADYEKWTCVKFVPRTTEASYLNIITGSNCASYVGYIGGKQNLILNPASGCVNYGTIFHEVMHALGFRHEQNRHDRDYYIIVALDNVNPRDNSLNKADPLKSTSFGVPYDYGSVMHYFSTALSNNRAPVFIPTRALNGKVMGQRKTFAWGDVRRINRMYKCNSEYELAIDRQEFSV